MIRASNPRTGGSDVEIDENNTDVSHGALVRGLKYIYISDGDSSDGTTRVYKSTSEVDDQKTLHEALDSRVGELLAFRERWGEHHVRVGAALHNVGVTQLLLDYNAGALHHLRQAVGILSEHPQPTLDDLTYAARALTVAARACRDDQAYAEAGACKELALRVARGALEGCQLRVAACLDECAEHAEVKGNAGDVDMQRKARGLREEALQIRIELLGEFHMEVASAHVRVATASLAKSASGLAHWTAALEIRRRALGPAHPLVAASMRQVGAYLAALGLKEDALAAHRDALAAYKTLYGGCHECVLQSLDDITDALTKMGREEEALEALQEALSVALVISAADRQDVGWRLCEIGVRLAQCERHSEAVDVCRELLVLANHPDDGIHQIHRVRWKSIAAAIIATVAAEGAATVGGKAEMGELLQLAVEIMSLEGVFASAPLLPPRYYAFAAELREALASVAEPKRAVALLREALALRREVRGFVPDGRSALERTLRSLAAAHVKARQWGPAALARLAAVQTRLAPWKYVDPTSTAQGSLTTQWEVAYKRRLIQRTSRAVVVARLRRSLQMLMRRKAFVYAAAFACAWVAARTVTPRIRVA